MDTIRIYGKSSNSHDTCNVLITYELVENHYDPVEYHDSYAVLHRVQLEPTVNSTLLIDVPLNDCDTREHFEGLLSSHQYGYDVKTAVTA